MSLYNLLQCFPCWLRDIASFNHFKPHGYEWSSRSTAVRLAKCICVYSHFVRNHLPSRLDFYSNQLHVCFLNRTTECQLLLLLNNDAMFISTNFLNNVTSFPHFSIFVYESALLWLSYFFNSSEFLRSTSLTLCQLEKSKWITDRFVHSSIWDLLLQDQCSDMMWRDGKLCDVMWWVVK